MDGLSGYRGEFAALGAALFWAVATNIWGVIGKNVTPLALNLLKGIFALAMLLVTLAFRGELFESVPGLALLLLISSGIIGIGIGDTAYFTAIKNMGPRRSLLMETMAPPFAGVLSWVFLGDALSLKAWVGIGVTMLGIGWVISERSGASTAAVNLRRGVVFGVLAALCQSVGAVLSHAAFLKTEISPLWSAAIRLAAGVAVLPPLMKLNGTRAAAKKAGPSEIPRLGQNGAARFWLLLLCATLIGTYLSLWLQQISFKYTSAGIAQTLLVTSPLFGIPMAMMAGEKVSMRAVFGVMIAVGGISLLF